ncbi:polyphosphate--glucose phosphotransferase [Corynebacterium terpenotabidum]|uniref:Polyphosphate glucokinase n=1 Tax=Corynebacterium terpenotabidum Y-11 TaxID=1200352 RepID=S4XK13_9CORY|nr:ROK family protein [Corynebacterium terpenotabidum]AGP30903.1 polyphosphate glucokinase [Corynebacterium terpenotabidum Y-11]
MAEATTGFGVDIGGSGIKGARVDLVTGEFIGERIKILTPQPATPEAVSDVVAELLAQAEWEGPVGITVPAVVQNQIARSAANIDPSWIGTDCAELFANRLAVNGVPRSVAVLNDADAAGLAEAAYGDPRVRDGAVLLLTFGTGIGSALMVNGVLYPNSELGHLLFPAMDAEHWASSAVKEREDLSYREWARRVSRVLEEYLRILNPQRIVVGGGVSRKYEKWGPFLTVDAEVFPAVLRNRAGIVGAAAAVRDGVRP